MSKFTKNKKKQISSFLQHRKPNLKFPKNIPKHWFGQSAFKTHLLNSFTLFFPSGEKYFIRSIQRVLKDIDNEELKLEAKMFIKQEAQHYIEHEKFLQNLRDHGYKIDHIINFIEKLTTKVIEPRLTPELNIAATAGLEHFTALLAEVGLSSGILKDAQLELRQLFEWHAAEEIEHKAVAYDIFNNIDGSYHRRILGLLIATATLCPFAAIITANLIIQDGLILNKKVWRDFVNLMFKDEQLFMRGFNIFLDYFAKDFHPNNNETSSLIDNIFNELNFQAAPA